MPPDAAGSGNEADTAEERQLRIDFPDMGVGGDFERDYKLKGVLGEDRREELAGAKRRPYNFIALKLTTFRSSLIASPGSGAFSTVRLGVHRQSSAAYAVKCVTKSEVRR